MNNIEEKLWNYIDGTCTSEEQQAIELLIANDEVYRRKHEELVALNNEFKAIQMDEPSMAFTYNVMEQIRTETARAPLKATIDKRIIKGIAAFFIITIAAIIIVMLGSIDWSASSGSSVAIPDVKVPQLSNYFTGPVIKGFLFFDLILGLFLLDGYLRRKTLTKQA